MEAQNSLINELAQRVGITAEQANSAIALVSKILLQKADPSKASSLLSKLPSSITNIFSDDEKQQFTSTQQSVNNDEVIRKLDTEAGIQDPKKAQQTTEEAVKLIQEKTGEKDLLDNVMGKFKNIDLNPFD